MLPSWCHCTVQCIVDDTAGVVVHTNAVLYYTSGYEVPSNSVVDDTSGAVADGTAGAVVYSIEVVNDTAIVNDTAGVAVQYKQCSKI